MTTWKYTMGSAEDFEGAPDEAEVKLRNNSLSDVYYVFAESFNDGATRTDAFTGEYGSQIIDVRNWSIIAQRERVTSVNDDRLAQCINNVNHPKHYTQGGIECIDAIKAATVGKTGIEAVCVANVVKYLWRYEEKNGMEDVKKARWYLERLISELSEGE